MMKQALLVQEDKAATEKVDAKNEFLASDKTKETVQGLKYHMANPEH